MGWVYARAFVAYHFGAFVYASGMVFETAREGKRRGVVREVLCLCDDSMRVDMMNTRFASQDAFNKHELWWGSHCRCPEPHQTTPEAWPESH